MKKIVLGLAFLGLGSMAMAQQVEQPKKKLDPAVMAQKRQEDAKAKLDKMAKELSLSADQVAKIEQLHKSEGEARKAMMQEQQAKVKADRDAQKAKRDAEMKKILSKDQYAKWEALRAEKEAKMKAGKAFDGERKFRKTEPVQK